MVKRYRNAAELVPPGLLKALQRYAAGLQLYIPRADERAAWGQRSGARKALDDRNELIRRRRSQGVGIDQLMAEFHLSYDSIRKIICGQNKSTGSRGGGPSGS
ncbi:MAG TPA: CD3324 family protein [Bacillota bacterium]|jgi:hypothetical protein